MSVRTDIPIIGELATEAFQELRNEGINLNVTFNDVLEFVDTEHQKENERHVRELLKQKEGRRHNIFPELRKLLDDIVERKSL